MSTQPPDPPPPPKRPRGRPAIGKVRNFHCPDDVWLDAETAAEREGQTVSEFIRDAMVAAARRILGRK